MNSISSSIPLGCSPIHGERDPKKIQQHLKEGIDPNNTCLSGMTPLHWSRNAEATSVLIEAGAKISARDLNLNTPLHLAPDAKSVHILIQHGANPNSRNIEGQTPLHMAKNIQIMESLIKAGADVNAYDQDRNTPLHYYAKDPQKSQLLIASGANLSLENRKGEKPSQFSKSMIYEGSITHNDSKIYRKFESNFLDFLLLSGLFTFGYVITALYLQKGVINANNRLNIPQTFMAFLGLFLNPFCFHFALIFWLFSYGFLYWIPSSAVVINIGIFLCVYLIYHGFMFLLTYKKYSEITINQLIDFYLLKNLIYGGLLPYYILLKMTSIAETGSGSGDYLAFFGIPFLFVFMFIALAYKILLSSPRQIKS